MRLRSRVIRTAMGATMVVASASPFLYGAQAQDVDYSGVVVPKVTNEGPASVSVAEPATPQRTPWSANSIRFRRAGSDIPAAFFAAYRHGAELVNAVSACHLDWTLLAAIGKIESNHGTIGRDTSGAGSRRVGDIYGIRLDGSHGTSRIADTDDGKLDGDVTFDRAVGPMQFLPSTWQDIAVDGDSDKKRNPQDIDDASLGTAVYLCAGAGNLSQDDKLEAAIFRYNHSQQYVDQVLALMHSYAGTGPLHATNAASFPGGDALSASDSHQQERPSPTTSTSPPASSGAKPTSQPETPKPTPSPAVPAKPAKPAPNPVASVVSPVQRATSFCQDELTTAQLNGVGGLTACVQAFVHGGVDAVSGLLGSLSATLDALLVPK
jgi:hypothetical protein